MNLVENYLLVEAKEPAAEATTDSGLILVNNLKEKQYIVSHVGPEAKVEVGSRVLFPMKHAAKTTIDGTPYLVVRENDLIAFWNREKV